MGVERGFNIKILTMDKSTRNNIIEDKRALNKTLKELELIDLYRTFHPKDEYMIFSSEHSNKSLCH